MSSDFSKTMRSAARQRRNTQGAAVSGVSKEVERSVWRLARVADPLAELGEIALRARDSAPSMTSRPQEPSRKIG